MASTMRGGCSSMLLVIAAHTATQSWKEKTVTLSGANKDHEKECLFTSLKCFMACCIHAGLYPGLPIYPGRHRGVSGDPGDMSPFFGMRIDVHL